MHPAGDPVNLWTELRRRKVFRVAVVYVATAFAVLQGADIMVPRLGIPDWVMSLIVLLVVLGFPVALVLAWALEVTPDGIRRTEAAAPDEAVPALLGRRTVFAAMLLVAVGGGIGTGWFLKPSTPVQDPTTSAAADAVGAGASASIAVLPFADLSQAGDQEYFSDGIAEEILNVLTRVEGLRVASRTSSFLFKGETKSIPLIAAELGVAHVLEGSVRKAGDQVRITAQLIAADGDLHLWSQTFDRELSAESLFAIQDEIAGAIVEALRVSLAIPVMGRARTVARTDNLDAYELYLRALGARSTMSRENAGLRVELLEQAVEVDPAFAEAWAEFASALVSAPGWRVGGEQYTTLDRAIEAAERSLALDPSNRTAFSALRGAFYVRNDWAQADAVLQRARATLPDFGPSVSELMGLGYLSRAGAEARAEILRSPEAPFPKLLLGLYLEAGGRHEEALEELEEAILAGYHGPAQWVMNDAYLNLGRTDAWTALAASDMLAHDPELLPLLPHLRDLLLAGPEQDGAATLRFRAIADELGFEVDDLVRPGETYGFRLPFAAVVALGHDDRVAQLLWTTMPKFWMWNSGFRTFRQSDAFRARVRDSGMLAYWQANGWPDLCRPVGAGDFECD